MRRFVEQDSFMASMIRHDAKMADTTLTLKAAKSRHLSLVVPLGAKGLSL